MSGRRARLYLTRIDPWSVTKAAFMLALSLAIVLVVMVVVLWWVLGVTGVLSTITRAADDIIGSTGGTISVTDLLDLPRVLGATLIIAAVQVVLISALSAVYAFLYNATVGLTGGVEVVLSEDA